jgi:hypothetical protein
MTREMAILRIQAARQLDERLDEPRRPGLGQAGRGDVRSGGGARVVRGTEGARRDEGHRWQAPPEGWHLMQHFDRVMFGYGHVIKRIVSRFGHLIETVTWRLDPDAYRAVMEFDADRWS